MQYCYTFMGAFEIEAISKGMRMCTLHKYNTSSLTAQLKPLGKEIV